MEAVLFATMLMTAATGIAQEGKEAAGPDIVVTGKNKSRDKEIRDYLSALNGLSGSDPIARFDRTELCPAAIGLGNAFDTAIVARMRRVAAAAAIPIAPEGCKTNALVIFADDKEQMIAALHKSYPVYFRTGLYTTMSAPRTPGPVTAWHVSARVDRYGVQIAGEGEEQVTVTVPEGASRLQQNVRPIFVASVVVIERKAVEGLTTTQIADYAAMRSFAEIDPARLKSADASTILSIMSSTMDSEVPITMTAQDLAYLRALYAVKPLRSAYSQRAEIRNRIVDDLDARDRQPLQGK